MRETVFLNGKFIAAEIAALPVLSPGFLCGIGVFETVRWYKEKALYLDAHLARIRNSSFLCGIKFPRRINKLKRYIKETVALNDLVDAAVRITVWKSSQGLGLLIAAKKYNPYPSVKYRNGFLVTVSRYRQNENSVLCRIKSTNRLAYELGFSQAKNKGFDEAIILNSRGYVTEATRSNIFIVNNGKIFTPGLSSGCLPGITRRVVFDLARICRIRICEINLTLKDIKEAEEAFLTNSLMGIMPLTRLDKYIIGKGRCARITKSLILKYSSLLK
jgi:branched-subunit amino acid aminotransferase/4-amino-4-deoxychorismate lyase